MIKIFIESGVNAAQKKGSKRTTNEQNFVETLVAHYFPHAVLGTDYLVVGVNGKDQLPNTQPVFVDNTLQGGTNLVLFDADTREKGGGFAIRKRKLLQQKEELGIEFDLFLWPNNHADGDFESLLMHLINPRHKGLIDCYRRYEKGISRMNRSHKMYMTQGRKGCIYSYIAAMKKNHTAQTEFSHGIWFFDNPEYWNLTSEWVFPLVAFLRQHFH